MYNNGPSKKLVVITACIPLLLTLAACKKTWTPPRRSATPTPIIKVVDNDRTDRDGAGDGLVPVQTLFPGKHGQEGTLTPTPTFTPSPEPTKAPDTGDPGWNEGPTPTPLPTPTFTPTPKPTNTPRPTRVPPTPVAPTPWPTPTPTPGSVDYVLITGTPTPRI
ncbi:MAG: hypothetical protein K6G60_04235 [Lachnospiraceae bacterium]|nr:hypothetical protein [Lachnospiraceae bacterium]